MTKKNMTNQVNDAQPNVPVHLPHALKAFAEALMAELPQEYLDKEAYNDNPMLLNLLEEDFKLVADKPDDYKPTAGEYILLTFEKPIKKKDEEQNKDRPVCLVTRDGMTIYHGKNLNPDILLPGDKIFTVIGDVTFIRKEEEENKIESEEEENSEDFNKT